MAKGMCVGRAGKCWFSVVVRWTTHTHTHTYTHTRTHTRTPCLLAFRSDDDVMVDLDFGLVNEIVASERLTIKSESKVLGVIMAWLNGDAERMAHSTDLFAHVRSVFERHPHRNLGGGGRWEAWEWIVSSGIVGYV